MVKNGKSLKDQDICEDLLIKVKEDLVKTEKKGNFVTEEAVNPPYIYLINMIIGCFLLLAFISYIKSVSTNYNSSSPRFDAKSCRSLPDGQTNSNFLPSPVSYQMRIVVSPGKVHQVFLNFRGEQLRCNFVSHLVMPSRGTRSSSS